MEEFQITDGTTTVDFVADSDYGLLGWPLQIAPFRRSRLSERSPYALVQEKLRVFITGTSPQDAQTNLLNLINLLDQSQRFANNRLDVSPVKLIYQPNAASGDTYECLVLGNNNQPMVSLPSEYASSSVTQVADDISISFLREGLWLESTEESNVTFTDLTTEGVQTVTFSAAPPTYSPLRVQFNLQKVVTPGGYHRGYCVFADDAALTNGTADNITAFTLDWQTASLTFTPPSVTSGQSMRAFVKLRNNSATVSWQVGVVDGAGNTKTSIVTIPAGSNDPQIIPFPPVTYLAGTALSGVIVRADQTDGAESIDVKGLMVLVGDANVFYFDFESPTSQTTVTIDHRMLTAPAPIVTQTGGFSVAGGGGSGFFSNKSSGSFGLFGVSYPSFNLNFGTGGQQIDRYKATLLPT